MNFNIIYDASVNSAPAAFKTAITAVAQFFQNAFTNPITVNIDVGYGEIAGQAMGAGALGESETFFNTSSYAQIHNALAAHATSADQISAVNSLPATDPTGGGNYWVSTAEAKALGLAGASSSIDGYVGFSSTFAFTYNNSSGVAAGTYDFFGVAAHEFTEVMGRSLFVGTDGIGANAYTPLDLFHYSSPGVHDFSGTTPGYFSLNGGATNLDNFNTNPNGDAGDWAGSAGHDSFLAFSSSGVVNAVSQTDLRVMNVLGYSTTPADITAPVLVHNNPLVDGVGKAVTISASSLAFSDPDNSDAQLTYTIVAGPAFGTLLKSGSATFAFTQADIDNGLITYRENGSSVSSDSFAFQVSDPAGNHTATQSFQFQIARAIETSGSTWLTQVGNQYSLYNSGGSGPVLTFSGAAVVAGQFGAWAPIGAEQTASGYEVAWKVMGSDQYTVWNTDGGGNYIGNAFFSPGASAVLEAIEPSFQQDLNGDGVIGPTGMTGTVIEAFGSTHLTEVGNQYSLFDGSGSGPVLQLGGAPVVAGQFGAWAPIGAEQTASGYEVAWKVTGADKYTVWNTDSGGNYIANAFFSLGADAALESIEPSFQQDLNGDGVIGVPSGAGALAKPTGSVVGTGDFNGDGQSDILWMDSSNTLTIAEMNGSSIVSQAALPAPPSSWRLAGTGDVNGDGKSDILWQNSGGDVGIWEMNGTSIVSAVSPGNPGSAWLLQGAADVDGDGKSDLLFLNPISNQTQTWLMNGTQVASVQAPVSTPGGPRSSAPVLGELEFYVPADPTAGMAGGSQTIASLPSPDPAAAFVLPQKS